MKTTTKVTKKILQVAAMVIGVATVATEIIPAPAAEAHELILIAHKVLDIIAINVTRNQGDSYAPATQD